MHKLLVLSFLLFLFSPSFAQNEVPKQKIKETIELNGTSFEKEMKLKVIEGKTLRYSVKGKITDGNFGVTVYDPNGKKENGFGLNACKGSGAKGSLEEVNTDPIPGIWVFKIENKDSKGSVNFTAFQNNRGF